MLTKAQIAQVEKLQGLLSEAESILEGLHQELTDKFESRSDRWQESERGMALEEFMSDAENMLTNVSHGLELHSAHLLPG